MTHLLTVNQFKDSGLPISDDISDGEILMAIATVEQTLVWSYLQDTLYGILGHPEDYTDIINAPYGTTQMMEHLVFSYLLYDRVRLTRYAPVIKTDEVSSEPSYRQVLEVAKMHWEVGSGYLRRICTDLGIDWQNVNRTDLLFNELVY